MTPLTDAELDAICATTGPLPRRAIAELRELRANEGATEHTKIGIQECRHDLLFGGHTCIKCGTRDGDVITELRAENAVIEAHRQRLNHILRTLEGDEAAGSCDWGGCDREADGWRESKEYGDFLPVCAQHMGTYEKLQEQNAALRAALEEIAGHTRSLDTPLFGLHCLAKAALASTGTEQGGDA